MEAKKHKQSMMGRIGDRVDARNANLPKEERSEDSVDAAIRNHNQIGIDWGHEPFRGFRQEPHPCAIDGCNCESRGFAAILDCWLCHRKICPDHLVCMGDKRICIECTGNREALEQEGQRIAGDLDREEQRHVYHVDRLHSRQSAIEAFLSAIGKAVKP